MGLFDLFTVKEDKKYINQLHERFAEDFPNYPQERLIMLSCLAGIMARVAYVDFEIDKNEVAHIEKSLCHWMKLSRTEAHSVGEIAVEQMKQLCGMDTRKFCTPLNDLLSIEERFHILESLFELAASDGIVENSEANEIDYISKALLLEHKYFVTAKSQVKEYLASLRK